MTRIPWLVLKGGDADNNAAHFMASAGPEGGDADDAAMHSVAGAGPEGGDTDDGGGAIYVGKDGPPPSPWRPGRADHYPTLPKSRTRSKRVIRDVQSDRLLAAFFKIVKD